MPEDTPLHESVPEDTPVHGAVPDHSGARRQAAIAGHTGDEDTARSLLDHEDPMVRGTALRALARLGRIDVTLVSAGLEDPAPSVRRRALDLAIAFPAIDLVPLLSDPDHSVVEQCAWACGERRSASAEVVDALCRVAADHEDSLCREAAVAALGSIGDPRALPTILAATSDRATVRRRAIIALAPFEGPWVDAALERAKSDRDWQVRQAAEDLLDGEPPGDDEPSGNDEPSKHDVSENEVPDRDAP